MKLNNSELQQSPSEQTHYDTKLLEDFANSLGISNDVTQLALTMWDDLVKRMIVTGKENKFFVCLIYMASIDLRYVLWPWPTQVLKLFHCTQTYCPDK